MSPSHSCDVVNILNSQIDTTDLLLSVISEDPERSLSEVYHMEMGRDDRKLTNIQEYLHSLILIIHFPS